MSKGVKKINRVYKFAFVLMISVSFIFMIFSDIQAESKGLNPETTITDDGEVYLVTDEMLEKLYSYYEKEQLPYFPVKVNTNNSKKISIKSEKYDELPDGYLGPIYKDYLVPYKIIGPDNRYQITDTQSHPYRAVVQIRFKKPNGKYARCSGALIGPDTVLTAGHCLYSHGENSDNTGWNKDFTVYPGRNGDLLPYGEIKVARKITVTGWTQNKDYNYDYGVLKLKQKPKVGYFGFKKHTSIPEGLNVVLTGYPGDKSMEQCGKTKVHCSQ